MNFGTRITSITQDTILPKVVDNILSDSFMIYRYIGTGKKWSGTTLKKPIKVAKNTLGGSFSGMDYHNTGVVETRQTLEYDVRGYEIPVAIPGLEEAVNSVDESQVIRLVQAELESSQWDMVEAIASMLYLDGTGNSNKDFNGLDNLNDDGTTASTIGGLSRSTYTSLKGTRTASSGAMTLAKMATLVSAVSGGSAASQRPTVIVSSEAEFNLYQSLLTSTVQATYEANGFPRTTRTSRGPIPASELKGAQGFISLTYQGIPWVADEKAPAQTIWVLNENYLEWYGLKSKKLQPITLGDSTMDGVMNDAPSANTGFQWRPFMSPIDQFAEVAHIYLLGNLVTWQPRRHGRLTGVTSAS